MTTILEKQTLLKIRQLTPREFWLLGQAVVLLPLVRVSLSRARVARLLRIADGGANKESFMQIRRANASSPGWDSQSIARLVGIAAEHGVYRARCLEQSLVLRWLLRKQGIEGRILFGARKQDQQLQVHAWVEVDGVTLNDDTNQGFPVFEEISATS